MPCGVLWAEEKLWVYFEAASNRVWATETAGGSMLVSQHIIAAYNGPNCVETNSIPEKFVSPQEDMQNVSFTVLPERIFVFLEQGALSCNRKDKSWSSVPVPLKAPRAFARGDRLYLYNQESILETTPALDQFKVLASVRRRPAMTPLDELLALEDPYLFQAAGRLMLALRGRTYCWDPDHWAPLAGLCPTQEALSFELLLVAPGMDEVLLRDLATVPGKLGGAVTAYYFGPRSAKPELWWRNQPNGASGGPPAAARYPTLPVRAPFQGLRSSFDGVVKQAPFAFGGQLFTLTLPLSGQASGELNFWRTNSAEPIAIPVTFPGRERCAPGADRVLLAANRIFLWSNAPTLWCIDGDSLFSELERISASEGKTAAARPKGAPSSAAGKTNSPTL